MNRLAAAAIAAFCAVLAAHSPSIAQNQRAGPGSATAPTLEGLQPKSPGVRGRRARSDADARHCLDLATNAQITRCAEKYL